MIPREITEAEAAEKTARVDVLAAIELNASSGVENPETENLLKAWLNKNKDLASLIMMWALNPLEAGLDADYRDLVDTLASIRQDFHF
jgi:hypothetical protein